MLTIKEVIIIQNYIGIFKTDIERNLDTQKDLENVFIVCKKEGEIYRYDDNTLVFYLPYIKRGNKIYDNTKQYILDFESGDKECRFYFKEEDLYNLVKDFGIITRGKDIIPWDCRKGNTFDKFKYNITVDGVIKKKNLDFKKSNIYLDKFRKEFGFNKVKKERIEETEKK